MKKVGFGYGVMCDKLEKQANAQGYTLGKEATTLDKLTLALNMVRIHGLFADSQVDRAYEKLNKRVIKALNPLPESTEPERSEDNA